MQPIAYTPILALATLATNTDVILSHSYIG